MQSKGGDIMKKRMITMLLAVLTLMSSGVIYTQSAQAVNIENSVTVIVNSRTVNFPDAPAYIDKNGRTQIPMRYIAEALGADVEWDGAARRASFSLEIEGNIRCVDFYISSEAFYVKNAPKNIPERKLMDTTAIVENDRTYVPARYVAESLGATVRWESSTRTVYITSSSPLKWQEPKKEQEPSEPQVPYKEPEPRDETHYDKHGLMLAPYANVFYQQWYETLRITYEGNRVFFSYTIPEGLPENTEFGISLGCDRVDAKKEDGPGWMYLSTQLSEGDRAAGWETSYLIPNPISGEVIKEIEYIPFEDIYYIAISCCLLTPRNGTPDNTKRYAQSSYRLNINAQDLKDSILLKSAYDWWSVDLTEYKERIAIDGAAIIKFK